MGNIGNLTLEGLFNLTLPTTSNKLKVTCRKTINVKPYETEEYNAEMEVEIDGDYTVMERSVLVEILHIALEFSIYTQVYLRKQITQEEFLERKQCMLDSIMTLCNKLATIDPQSKLLAQVMSTI